MACHLCAGWVRMALRTNMMVAETISLATRFTSAHSAQTIHGLLMLSHRNIWIFAGQRLDCCSAMHHSRSP